MFRLLNRRGWLAGIGSGGFAWLTGPSAPLSADRRSQPAEGWVSVRSRKYRALGDGRANDGPAIQGAHDDIVRSGTRGVLYLPAGMYRVTSGLELDASHVSVVSDGAVLDATPLRSGSAVTITGTASRPYDQSVASVAGLKLLGPGRSHPVVGVRFNRAAGTRDSASGPSHLTLRNCNLSGFRQGFSFENYCYNVELYSCDAYDCGTCISLPSDTVDSGERIVFFGGTFFNSDLGIESRNPNSMLYLIGTSLDYNERQLVIHRAHVTLTDCHVEGRDHSAPPIDLGGNGASLHVSGGWFVLTGAHPRRLPALIHCSLDTGSAGGVVLSGTFLNNLMTNATPACSPRLATGSGPVRLIGTQSYDISQNPRIIGEAQNRLRDGGFENDHPADPVIIADTVSPVADRCTGTNLVLTVSERFARQGSRALRCLKRGPSGTAAAFVFIVPISHGQIADFELYYRKPGTGAGTVYISHGHGVANVSAAGIPGIANGVIAGADEVRLTERDSGWIRVASGEPTARAPGWATCFFVEVNLVSFSGGEIYFDDAIVTVIE